MLLSLLPYAANAVVLAVYFISHRPHPLYDITTIHVGPIVVFALFAVLHVLAFSLQDTTRQLVRIYLLRESGIGYDDRLVPAYQIRLTPNWTIPVTPIWIVSQVASFAWVLFAFGWGIAIGSHLLAHSMLTWIPIPYRLLLPSVRRHINRPTDTERLLALMEGFDIGSLTSIIDEALSERRNLADWWAKLLWEKTAENVAESRQDRRESQLRTEHRRSESAGTGDHTIPIEFFDLAQECFDIGHQLVAYRDHVSKQVGTLWSTVRNHFRSVDYTVFVAQARDIQGRAAQLRSDIDTFLTPASDRERHFADLLGRHAECLHQYSDVLVQQAEFMYRKSRSVSAPGTSWAEWRKLFSAREAILQECQKSGAELTLYFHEMNGNR